MSYKPSVNRFEYSGNIGRKPELENKEGKTSMCHVSIAESYSQKNKQTDEYEDKVRWHRVTLFGKDAENIVEYCDKGDYIWCAGYVDEGRDELKYTDKDGVERFPINFVVTEQHTRRKGGDDSGDNKGKKKGSSKKKETPQPVEEDTW